MISEICSDCGAERSSYMGGSHFRKCRKHDRVDRVCCNGRSADDYWRKAWLQWMGWPLG